MAATTPVDWEPVAPWPFVGRGAELDELAAAFVVGHVRVIVGDAGVGKTRLLRELAGRLDPSRWDVAWLAASRAAATVPLAAVAPLATDRGSIGGGADLFTRLANAVVERARRARLAIFVDDAHLLDPASAAFVEWAACESEATIALTVRSGVPLPDALVRLRRSNPDEWQTLGPLGPTEVDGLLNEVLGGPADGLTVDYIWRTTGGNPLYVREVVTAARRSEALVEREGVWGWRPDTPLPAQGTELADLVRSRIDFLPAGDRDALELVACGEPLEVATLERLVDDHALARLEREAFLVVEREGGVLLVRLAHPLFGEVLRATMLPLRARAVHRALVGTIDPDDPALDEGSLLRLATWAVVGEVALPPTILTRAGRAALERWDLGLAETLARDAMDADDGWPATQLLADVLKMARRPDELAPVVAAASRQARSDRERARSSITTAETLYWGLARPEEAAAALDGAVEDPAVAAMGAMLNLFEGRVEVAYREAGRLLARPALGDDTRLWLQSTAAFAAIATGRAERALVLADEGGRLSQTSSSASSWSAAQFRWARCGALADLGRLDEAELEADAGYRDEVEGRVAERVAGFALLGGLISRHRGALSTAARQLREAAALLGENDPFRLTSLCLVELATAVAMAGDASGAAVALAEAEDRRGAVNRMLGPGATLVEAWIARAVGDRSAATDLARRAADLAADGGTRGAEWVALHAAARFGAPARVVDRLAALADVVDGPWAALAARHAEALAHEEAAALDAVATEFADRGSLLLAAEAALAAAAAHRRDGRRGSGALAATRAASWLATCGRPACPTLPEGVPQPLTVREQEIAGLAAAGFASRLIAGRLGLSIRTVDNHLGRIYRKLGVHGRAELMDYRTS